MHHIDFGDNNGKRVLILHGWAPKGHSSWIPIAEKLTQYGVSTTLVDMPGFGQTPSPADIWGAREYADYIIRWSHDSNTSFDLVLGHSFGGGVASQIASFNPDFTDKIVLVAPAIVRKPAPEKPFTASNPLLSPLKAVYRILFGSKDYNQSKGIMKDIMKRVIHEDLTGDLSRIQANTLLLWGTKDTYTPYEDAAIITKKIPTCQLKTYMGINHGIHLHASDTLIKDIIAHLES
jgi:pimeloyl-ACP methyl ester carboxylesterase